MKSRFMRSSLVHLRQLPSRTPYATRPRPPCRVEGVGSRRDAAHDVSVRSGPHACSGAEARLACRRVALRLQRVPTVLDILPRLEAVRFPVHAASPPAGTSAALCGLRPTGSDGSP